MEIYGVLDSIHAIKDMHCVHYETLVAEYERLVAVIREDHMCAARKHITGDKALAKLVQAIDAECNEITDYRVAAERWHLEIDSRSKDRLVSFGEKLSCQFITALLEERVR